MKKIIEEAVEMTVTEYIGAHNASQSDDKITRNDVYKMIKDGKIKAHKGERNKWILEVTVQKEIEVEDECPSSKWGKKEKPSKKTVKTYTRKEFVEKYNEKHPKTPITLGKLRAYIETGAVATEVRGGKRVIIASPSKRIK